MPKVWNHFESVQEGGPQTNYMLESHNRTWNSLVGHSPNVSYAVGQDMTTNTGRKQKSVDARERLKFVGDAFDSMQRADYISTLAHDRQTFDQ